MFTHIYKRENTILKIRKRKMYKIFGHNDGKNGKKGNLWVNENSQ